jgi:membrane associated rhomboid family serine protease
MAKIGDADGDRIAGVRLVLGMVALMWVLEVVDFLTGHPLDAFGIQPRDADGLIGVATAPFLHFGFGHLLANTVPFVVMGVVIALGGTLRLLAVTVIAALVSGLGVWLVAPATSVTAGASGVVFGYATYLVTRGVLARNPLQLAVGVVVVAVLGTGLLSGILPQAGISWQGHLFGAAGGVLAARLLHRRRRPTPLVPRDLQ